MFMMKWGTLRIQKMKWARHAAHAGMPMSINCQTKYQVPSEGLSFYF